MIESSIVNGVFLPNRESCLEYLRKLRWPPDGVRCPHCGSSRIHRDGYTEKGAAKYHCLNCHEYLNDLTNSVLVFVREVQEIAEKIEGEISLKDLVEIDEIYITAVSYTHLTLPTKRIV